MILSTPEGADKPAKYPLMFQEACGHAHQQDGPHALCGSFDLEKAKKDALALNPKLRIIELSCKTKEGLAELDRNGSRSKSRRSGDGQRVLSYDSARHDKTPSFLYRHRSGGGFSPLPLQAAVRHRLSGFVQNRPDGVIAEVEGPAEAVEAFSIAVTAELPPLADVAEITDTGDPALGDRGFGSSPARRKGSPTAISLPTPPPVRNVSLSCFHRTTVDIVIPSSTAQTAVRG